jgi:two-component system LytT family response regulator
MTTIRALIVEDEPLARRTLREIIADVPWLECVGEAETGPRAVQMIDTLTPDLVFLDIEMPELNGLQVLDRISHEPAVIFTTAYDRYAVSAF